jgi:deoxyribodipyrimidine photolyase-related protein
VFHSALSPCLNLGLLTPDEVVNAVLERHEAQDLPLASIEGFVRQVIGWREFVRGIYRVFGDEQESSNFWDHQRGLTDDWYQGTTGIAPLDDAIKTSLRLGWAHHIQRLMVLGNLMTLCEIRPADAWRWFMEMYVDSSEWVMGPNVYGMGIFSDGGVFATKPYICGSNYLLKMSDYSRGDWCDTVDGLYWRFIDKHREFFASNPRLALMPKALDRLNEDRRETIFIAAETFLDRFTRKDTT